MPGGGIFPSSVHWLLIFSDVYKHQDCGFGEVEGLGAARFVSGRSALASVGRDRWGRWLSIGKWSSRAPRCREGFWRLLPLGANTDQRTGRSCSQYRTFIQREGYRPIQLQKFPGQLQSLIGHSNIYRPIPLRDLIRHYLKYRSWLKFLRYLNFLMSYIFLLSTLHI